MREMIKIVPLSLLADVLGKSAKCSWFVRAICVLARRMTGNITRSEIDRIGQDSNVVSGVIGNKNTKGHPY